MGQSQPNGLQDVTGSLGYKMIAATRRAWSSYWTHRAVRATAGILHTLDDRALKDIGLVRSEIESIASCECQRRGARAGAPRVPVLSGAGKRGGRHAASNTQPDRVLPCSDAR